MNSGTLLLGVAGLVVGGIAVAVALGREEEESEETGPELPPIRGPQFPPIRGVPTNPPTYQWPPVPPSDFPIIGGQYVDSINKWCPPGYLYNGNNGMCEALESFTLDPSVFQQINMTQGNGDASCCDSCTAGGVCTGCK